MQEDGVRLIQIMDDSKLGPEVRHQKLRALTWSASSAQLNGFEFMLEVFSGND